MVADVIVKGWSKIGFIGVVDNIRMVFNIYVNIEIDYAQNYAGGFVGLLENTNVFYLNVYSPVFKIVMNDGGKPSGMIYGCIRDVDTGECTS